MWKNVTNSFSQGETKWDQTFGRYYSTSLFEREFLHKHAKVMFGNFENQINWFRLSKVGCNVVVC